MIHNQGITIGITGGIGAGKTVVSRIVAAMGYPVYDCDSRARYLMDNSEEIKTRIAHEISPDTIVNCEIDRRKLGDIVFNDSEALAKLNSIVHSAVKDDFLKFREDSSGTVFVESAILLQCCFASLVDTAWVVIAPREVRIERVMLRNGLTREQVEARISAQDTAPLMPFLPPLVDIVNDGVTPLLHNVTELLQKI